ncbi:hypothetical protein KM043_003061 [Ampulex compressa]|nr:hypothetical protein KM043_003061 [Ampulex compressa]
MSDIGGDLADSRAGAIWLGVGANEQSGQSPGWPREKDKRPAGRSRDGERRARKDADRSAKGGGANWGNRRGPRSRGPRIIDRPTQVNESSLSRFSRLFSLSIDPN